MSKELKDGDIIIGPPCVLYESAPQLPPRPNDNPHVIDAARALLESRREVGMQNYGVPLQTGNGRDFGRDADEEMADWLIYWTGYRIEHGRKIREMSEFIGKQAAQIIELTAEIDRLRREAGAK